MEKEEKREKELNEEKQIINFFLKESNVITKFEDREFILSLFSNKPVRTKLLYDSRINGDTAKAFHSNCDGKSPTIYIIKSETGYIFGGYLSQPWKSENISLLKVIISTMAISVSVTLFLTISENLSIKSSL